MPSWRLILIAAVVAIAGAWHIYERGRAYRQGQTAERVIWQERQAMATAKANAERQRAQEQINRIEQDYLARIRSEKSKLADLETALEMERAENEKANPGCPDRPAISKRLRDAIAPIGR